MSRYIRTLPNDYARCEGNTDKVCINCMRRIAMSEDSKGKNKYEARYYIMPTASDGVCRNQIAQHIPRLPKDGLFK